MKIRWKRLLTCLAIPLSAGGLSAFLTQDSMEIFAFLRKPPFAPPGWLFPIVWTILFLLMGTASYLVLTSGQPRSLVRRALRVYAVQLVVNFFWSIFFFRLDLYLFSFFWLVFLWLLIWATLFLFGRLTKPAGILLVPYLLWVTFAGYLNFSIYLLN